MKLYEGIVKMKITNLYGLSSTSTALIAQNMVERYAEQLGCKELGVYRYDVRSDSADMLRTRLDGIFASVQFNDTIIFQLPTWNGITFDKQIVERSLVYHKAKRIIFVHDVIPFMWESNMDWIHVVIDTLNLADVLILPTKQMEERLRPYGLKVKKIVYQDMWDFETHARVNEAPFSKQLFFLGNIDKFDFIKHYDSELPIHSYSVPSKNQNLPKNVFFHDFLPSDRLVEELNQMGGFGLVWSEDKFTQEYLKVCLSFKIGTYLSANIPVVIPRYLSNAEIIEKNHLGILVDSIEEAVKKINQITPEEYQDMQRHITDFGYLIKNGYFTKKAIVDAVHLANRVDM